MTLTFSLKRSSTKSKRTHKKFPRYKFKDFTEKQRKNTKVKVVIKYYPKKKYTVIK